MTRLELMELAEECSDVLIAMEDDLLQNIAEYLSGGRTDIPAAQWKIQQLASLGKLDKANIRTIAEYSGIAADMEEIAMTRSALKAVGEMDEGFGKLAADCIISGTEVPMEETALQTAAMFSKQAKDRLNKVNTVMRYFAKNTAAAAVYKAEELINKQQHLDTLNKAAGKVIMGAESRQTAVRQCIKEMSEKGIPAFVDAAGRQWSPEAYINMDVRTTCSNVAHEAQFTRMNDYGIDLLEVDSHAGARPKCALDQGEIFSKSGKHKKYPAWSTSSYGEPDGILGINCGHHIYPYIEGVSTQTYFPYDKEENDKLYKQKQEQRRLEREVRSAKREFSMLNAAGDKEGAKLAKERVKSRTAAYNAYCEKTGLPRKADRFTVTSTANKKVSISETPSFNPNFKANWEVINSNKYVHKYRDLTKFGFGDKNIMRNAIEIIENCDGTEFEEIRLFKYLSGKMHGKPIKLNEYGTQGRGVGLPIGDCKPGSIVLLHNHPNSTAFSFDDFSTLNNNPEIRTIIAAGHDGTVYRLSVGNGKRLDMSNELDYNYYYNRWRAIYNNGHGDISSVIAFSKALGWEFEKK